MGLAVGASTLLVLLLLIGVGSQGRGVCGKDVRCMYDVEWG